MRTIWKMAIGGVMAAGAAVAVAAPAAAQVSFGIGVGPAYPAYPSYPAYSCYDAYGNYVYSYPYCTAYYAPAPVYAPPVVEPYLSLGFGTGWGWGGGYRHFDRGFHGGGYAMRGGERGGGGHRRG